MNTSQNIQHCRDTTVPWLSNPDTSALIPISHKPITKSSPKPKRYTSATADKQAWMKGIEQKFASQSHTLAKPVPTHQSRKPLTKPTKAHSRTNVAYTVQSALRRNQTHSPNAASDTIPNAPVASRSAVQKSQMKQNHLHRKKQRKSRRKPANKARKSAPKSGYSTETGSGSSNGTVKILKKSNGTKKVVCLSTVKVLEKLLNKGGFMDEISSVAITKHSMFVCMFPRHKYGRICHSGLSKVASDRFSATVIEIQFGIRSATPKTDIPSIRIGCGIIPFHRNIDPVTGRISCGIRKLETIFNSKRKYVCKVTALLAQLVCTLTLECDGAEDTLNEAAADFFATDPGNVVCGEHGSDVSNIPFLKCVDLDFERRQFERDQMALELEQKLFEQIE